MKKIVSILLVLFIFISNPIFFNKCVVYADSTGEETTIEQELDQNIQDQLNSLDTSQLDEMFQEIATDEPLFSDETFVEKLKSIISGNLEVDASSLLNYTFKLFVDDVLDYLPYVCLIIAIAVLYSMVSGMGTNSKNKSIGEIVHFVCYGSIVVIVVLGVSNLLNISTNTLSTVKTQMELVFPLLLTVLTAIGGSVSVSVYQPAMAMLSGTVISIFTSVLVPLFSFKLVFTIISNLTTSIKFNKFAEFFDSCFKWIMGIILTIFTAFVSIQGLMAGSIDSVSIRTAKYTIKGAIPFIGGFLSDGISLITVSSVLIKNAVGMCGLLLLFFTILMPILKIIVFSFLMKLAAAILEPIADSRVTSFVSSISKSISQLIALLLGVTFMYFIMVGLVMCSANFM